MMQTPERAFRVQVRVVLGPFPRARAEDGRDVDAALAARCAGEHPFLTPSAAAATVIEHMFVEGD